MAGPLDGILVVALEQAVAAPLCSQRLARAGARVIKIERPEGDFARHYDHVARGESAYFVWLNQGKESIVLDLSAAGDRALLDAMIARADVFLQNLGPGAAERAGLGSGALRARHPRLVTCDITGFDAEGPAGGRKAYDLLIQGETGLAAISGAPDAPGRIGVSVADIACGMNAHAAILEALIARGIDGRGRGVAVSLFDSLADWMSVPLLHLEHGGRAPPRVGLAHPTIAPYGVFTAGCGGAIILAAQNERDWRGLCGSVLERADLLSDPRFRDNDARVRHRAALEAEIGATLATAPRAHWLERLARARLAFGALNEVADFARHPALRRHRIETPGGPLDLPAPPARGAQDAPLGPVPRLDAHGPALRAEFGGAAGM